VCFSTVICCWPIYYWCAYAYYSPIVRTFSGRWAYRHNVSLRRSPGRPSYFCISVFSSCENFEIARLLRCHLMSFELVPLRACRHYSTAYKGLKHDSLYCDSFVINIFHTASELEAKKHRCAGRSVCLLRDVVQCSVHIIGYFSVDHSSHIAGNYLRRRREQNTLEIPAI
jgi:hypothetical protein